MRMEIGDEAEGAPDLVSQLHHWSHLNEDNLEEGHLAAMHHETKIDDGTDGWGSLLEKMVMEDEGWSPLKGYVYVAQLERYLRSMDPNP